MPKKTNVDRVETPKVISMKKPTKADLQKVLEYGVESAEISDIIKRDLFNRDENNQTALTKTFDKILKSDDLELITKMKKFLKTQYQTMIKNKSTQQAVNLSHKTTKLTVKKVTMPMIEDNGEKYVDSFNESERGQFRVVVERKKATEPKTFEEELLGLIEKHQVDTGAVEEFLINQGHEFGK